MIYSSILSDKNFPVTSEQFLVYVALPDRLNFLQTLIADLNLYILSVQISFEGLTKDGVTIIKLHRPIL